MSEEDQSLLEEIAYEAWENRGRPMGSPQIDWAYAEQWLQSSRELDHRLEWLQEEDEESVV